MKREFNNINIPFKDNLAFYVPCKNGTLKDQIGEGVPSTSAGCSITWDSEIGTYRFYANGVYNYAGYWNLSQPLDIYNGCTLFVDGEVLVDYGNKYNCYMSCDSLESGNDNINFGHYRLTHFTQRMSHEIIPGRHKFACTLSDGYLRSYQDGVFCFDQSWGTPAQRKPATGIAVAQIHSDNIEFEIAAYDIRVYNAALNYDEINQL